MVQYLIVTVIVVLAALHVARKYLPNSWRTHAGATLPLYTGGRVESQITAASETERATTSDRAAALNDLVLETNLAYVNVLFARENARVLGEAVASYEAHLKDARNRLELGLSASNEVLAVTVERERAELGRLQSENSAAMVSVVVTSSSSSGTIMAVRQPRLRLERRMSP